MLLLLAVSLTTSYAVPTLIKPYAAEQSNNYYPNIKLASWAIDGDLGTTSVSGTSANSWLRIYLFNIGKVVQVVGKVVIEKGWQPRASCLYQVFIYNEGRKSACGEMFTYPQGYYYNSYDNTTVDCGGMSGNSVVLEQSVCSMYVGVYEIKMYLFESRHTPPRGISDIAQVRAFLLQFADARHNDESILWSGWYRDSGVIVCGMPRFDSVPRVDRECKRGAEYDGTMSTARGYRCQRWDSQTPNRHSLGDRSLPANYCRNPDHNEIGAWCYLDTNKYRWAYCDIPPCKRNKVIFFGGQHWLITYGKYKDNLTCSSGAAYVANKIEKNLSMTKFYFHKKLDPLDDTCDVEEESPVEAPLYKPSTPGPLAPPAPIKPSLQHQHFMHTIPGFKELYNEHINNEHINNQHNNNQHFGKPGNNNQHFSKPANNKAPPTPDGSQQPNSDWGWFQPPREQPQQQRHAQWQGQHRRPPPHLRRPPHQRPHFRRPFM